MTSKKIQPSKFWQKLIPLLANPRGLAVDRWFMRTFNYSFMGPMFTRAGGFPDRPHLLLKTIHWKTGVLKEVVLPYTKEGDSWIVIGSHGGRPTDAIWSLNIRANDAVWVCVDRKWHFCRASIAQGSERERLWAIANADGGYNNYTKIAKQRQLPVVLLDPTVERSRPQEDPLPG